MLSDGRVETFQVLVTPGARSAAELEHPSAAITQLLVHESAHPFVNPWVDARAERLLAPARTLFAEVERAAAPAAAGPDAPRVVRLVPADGDRAVEPGVAALVMELDHEMSGGVSILGEVPEVIGAPEWNEALTVLTVPVRMRPAAAHALSLNGPTETGFASAKGVALAPRDRRFTIR